MGVPQWDCRLPNCLDLQPRYNETTDRKLGRRARGLPVPAGPLGRLLVIDGNWASVHLHSSYWILLCEAVPRLHILENTVLPPDALLRTVHFHSDPKLLVCVLCSERESAELDGERGHP